MTDAELDATVNDIIADFPNVGCKRMSGLLLGRGLRIQQSRIRECMRRVNPEGVLLRALELRLIQRRSYYVQGPLSLWHIDGTNLSGNNYLDYIAWHWKNFGLLFPFDPIV